MKTLVPLMVAAVGLSASILLLLFMLIHAERLVDYGLVGKTWYVALVILGLTAAAILFALFKSYASYSANVLGGKLELGGPGVLMLAIVVLGFQLAPEPLTDFDITVFVQDEQGISPLMSQGKLALYLGADKRIESIGVKGEARFINIPASFKNKAVKVALLEVRQYKLSDGSRKITLDSEALNVTVEASRMKLKGSVQDMDGNPIFGATIKAHNRVTKSDIYGQFSLWLPGNLDDTQRGITVSAPGFEMWRGSFILGSTELVVLLTEKY
jgi:hypothetical protein